MTGSAKMQATPGIQDTKSRHKCSEESFKSRVMTGPRLWVLLRNGQTTREEGGKGA